MSDTPLAPPLRMTLKYPSIPVPHSEVADSIGWFLNAYRERNDGTSNNGPKNEQEAQALAAAAFGDGTTDAAREMPKQGTAGGGRATITSALNRLREELR